MITKWKVFNFKSIREETELELGPLTIFAGANSSGKSTFIQSILLVAQTLAHKVGSRSVILNGAFTSLGQFDDLKSSGSESDQISIKCTCRPLIDNDAALPKLTSIAPRGAIYYDRSNQLQEIACEMSFDANPSSSQRELFQIQPRHFATMLSCIVRDEDNLDQKAEIAIRHSSKALSEIEGLDDTSDVDDHLRISLAYDVDLDEDSIAEVKEDFRSAQPVGCMLRHFLPERIIYSIDTIVEDANSITIALQNDGRRSLVSRRKNIFLSSEVKAVIRDVLKDVVDYDAIFKPKDVPNSLFQADFDEMSFGTWFGRLRELPSKDRLKIQQALRDCDNLFERIYDAMRLSTTGSQNSKALVQQRPPQLISDTFWYLNNFFSTSLKYLGPLRDAPKPLYPLAPSADPHDVGLRGEYTASILELHKNKKIRYIPSSSFIKPTINRNVVIRSLEAAVIDWLQYLGVASSVKSRDMGKLGHELKVTLANSDVLHDLTHVGVGVSQVLPILVMCLLSDTDSTLVFEQPELHLHPKVQTRLGDFFLSMALCNKQCIVESHSEYLIDRLRFRSAAASADSELNHLAKIYFVDKPSTNSIFREVVINEYGAIQDWPEDFFDQSQKEAEEILRAALNKKRAKKGRG